MNKKAASVLRTPRYTCREGVLKFTKRVRATYSDR